MPIIPLPYDYENSSIIIISKFQGYFYRIAFSTHSNSLVSLFFSNQVKKGHVGAVVIAENENITVAVVVIVVAVAVAGTDHLHIAARNRPHIDGIIAVRRIRVDAVDRIVHGIDLIAVMNVNKTFELIQNVVLNKIQTMIITNASPQNTVVMIQTNHFRQWQKNFLQNKSKS